ncbi:response regulator receiver domain protein (CheY) [Sulfurimonas gotlandica GD1]|uniref:Response regulator receiver domain protein (CheY) n=1 Tax=Sulfurimonas gotlandica (strain DSM 19862 / JCM 16533 / GD1) TaxID=929558 RepID=B6BJA1_SULGG|nr:response regulator [Sulfurimonas gotlandica]EDZ63364.1 response regulator receiver domain protein [Sulfurimonas gotlandica GD1]EHP30621.1 response regulator receiver domain protein (CheY) [Sulfurimonas gotlandica GD1]
MAKKIILVDDSRTILVTAEMALDELVADGSITLVTYLSPVELRDALVEGREDFDLLISDVNMPQLDGLELVTEIKQLEAFKTKPILILTTESSAQMKARGKEIGVTGWMVKPFSDEKLVKSIKMVLGI